MRDILQNAVADQRAHFECGTPLTERQGFKEANIASTVSHAFRKAGYYAYPEIRFDGGSIDAVFLNRKEAIICEWKQLYTRSISLIEEQTKRMKRFADVIHLREYGFKIPIPRFRLLWVCDTWEPNLKDWWRYGLAKGSSHWPFGGWRVGQAEFDSFGEGWDPYSWLWAYTNRLTNLQRGPRCIDGPVTGVIGRSGKSDRRGTGD